eukprot:g24645.t1
MRATQNPQEHHPRTSLVPSVPDLAWKLQLALVLELRTNRGIPHSWGPMQVSKTSNSTDRPTTSLYRVDNSTKHSTTTHHLYFQTSRSPPFTQRGRKSTTENATNDTLAAYYEKSYSRGMLRRERSACPWQSPSSLITHVLSSFSVPDRPPYTLRFVMGRSDTRALSTCSPSIASANPRLHSLSVGPPSECLTQLVWSHQPQWLKGPFQLIWLKGPFQLIWLFRWTRLIPV